MNLRAMLLCLICISCGLAEADRIDDSDFSTESGVLRSIPSRLEPTEVHKTALKGSEVSVAVFLKKGQQQIAVKNLEFEGLDEVCNGGRTIKLLRATLETDYFIIQDWRPYYVAFTAQCGFHYDLIFENQSPEGEALNLWKVAYAIQDKLGQIDRLGFWERKLAIVWPSDGNYYAFGQVHLTNGDHWDVVGHEIGHAVYRMINLGDMVGGSHYIDQCYSEGLALSEGWASFFSAWISINLDNPNAQFEYMVPRRAPIQIEIVPEDVCAGPTSEWRVFSFLWDVIDKNNDGEISEVEFQVYWDLSQGHMHKGITEHAMSLIEQGISGEHIRQVWRQNFLSEPPGF